MSEQNQPETTASNWKARLYIVGSIIGAALGFMSAYLFAKEAEEEAEEKDKAPEISATTLLGLGLSILGLVRQIAETGRKKKDGKK